MEPVRILVLSDPHKLALHQLGGRAPPGICPEFATHGGALKAACNLAESSCVTEVFKILPPFAVEPRAQRHTIEQGVEPVLVQSLLSVGLCRANDFRQASGPIFNQSRRYRRASRNTKAHISGAVVAFPVSGLRLNCCFLIFSANSMPRIVTATVSKLEPEHLAGFAVLFAGDLARSRCSGMQDRTCTLGGKIPEVLSLSTARCEAA